MTFSRLSDDLTRCCGDLQHIKSPSGRETPWRRSIICSLVTAIDSKAPQLFYHNSTLAFTNLLSVR